MARNRILTLAIPFLLIAASPNTPAASETPSADRSFKPAMAVEAIASRNRPPELVVGHRNEPMKPVFPADYDWAEYYRVDKAVYSLARHAEEAWPELIAHLGDDRYSISYRGIEGGNNYSVGDVCERIITDAISEAYFRHAPEGKLAWMYLHRPDVPRGKDLRPWCEARRAKKLYELQVEMCDWAVNVLPAFDGDPEFGTEDKTKAINAIKAEKTSLLATRKAVLPAGYDDRWVSPEFGKYGEPPSASPSAPPMLENVEHCQGEYRLARGLSVEGVVLLKQGRWSADELRVFRQTPWLDAASVRIRWAELEPQDQQFDFSIAEQLLEEVKRYNASHPSAHRTLHVRVMGGVHVPRWFEQAGVRFYDTQDAVRGRPGRPIRVPLPYDNPEYLRQLREVYRAMAQRFGKEPLVTVYHGTWSAGPWDEIFHPQGTAALPPDYTPQKFVHGMIEQLDVLLDEFCAKGLVAELPYSGKYPSKDQIDITGPLTARIVERLGKRSPLLYIQSNGWGMTNTGKPTVSWGHERDIHDAFGQVNLAFQALGTNAGGGWMPQGDWVPLVELARQYEAAYVEIYPPDLLPVDSKHRIEEALDWPPSADAAAGLPRGFLGFRRWLRQRNRILYQREGTIVQRFASDGPPGAIERVRIEPYAPDSNCVKAAVRVRQGEQAWSGWRDTERVGDLPPSSEAEVRVTLHTDDGCVSPRVHRIAVEWKQ